MSEQSGGGPITRDMTARWDASLGQDGGYRCDPPHKTPGFVGSHPVIYRHQRQLLVDAGYAILGEPEYPADASDVIAWRDVPDAIAHDAVDVLMAMSANLPEGNRKQAIVRAVLALVALRSPNSHVIVAEEVSHG